MSHPFDLDRFVKNYDLPLQLVRTVTSVESIPGGVQLVASTLRFMRTYRDRYGTLVEVGMDDGLGDPVVINVEFYNTEIVRFRMYVGQPDGMPANDTPMVVDGFGKLETNVDIALNDEMIVLTTVAIQVTIWRDPWRMEIKRADDVLFDTIPAAVYQHPPTGMSGIGGASMTDAWPWFFRDLYPLGFVRDPQTGMTQVFETARLRHDEHFYGFGEKFSTLDKRGQMINLWQTNATGNTWVASYKNVPFFMSSRGFGMFINSAYPIRYHLGDLSHTHYTLHLQDDLLDYYFIVGEDFKEILPRYTSITGKPGLPPLWSFGIWMSRMSYNAQDQVEKVAEDLRAYEIPCDVIHIDTDWFDKPWVNDLSFSTERFPNPAAMIAKLRELGFRTTLWQIPYISTESRFYAEGIEGGYFAKDDNGDPRHIAGFFGQTAVIDYSNPEAVAWMQSKFDPLFDMGVAAIKTDFGEGAPIDAHYATVDGLQMHNLYPLLYNAAIYKKTVERTGEGIVWGRSAYAGSQRYPVQWGGDPAVLWGDLANLWHGGLGFGLSGFPFWSVDIGGFGGTPSPELYIRWVEAGLFVSHPRAHGPIAREPWTFGDEAVRIFRKYARLRYQLIPYVWSSANHCVETSLPMMRPLLLDWPDDPTTMTLDDQFLFGEWLLIAPALDETNRRKVYLPEGRWFDYWTKKMIDGPRWIPLDVPLDMLPIYVRGGAIIPMTEPVRHTGEIDWSKIVLDVYPDGESSFVIHDENSEQVLITCAATVRNVQIYIGPGRKQYHIRLNVLAYPVDILANQVRLTQYGSVDALGRASAGWYVGRDGMVTMKIDVDEEVLINVFL